MGRKHFLFFAAACAFFTAIVSTALTKEFEIFDGRFYNNLYYPRIDMIEWSYDGAPPHMEFHIYSKQNRLELTAVPGDKNGKPVLWLMIDLPFRNERVCRHVLAPMHFKEGDKIYAYRDDSFGEYDNIFVSTHPMAGKRLVEYKMQDYAPCEDEMASNKPNSGGRLPASSPQSAKPTSSETPVAVPGNTKKDPKNIGVDYDNAAVPFSF